MWHYPDPGSSPSSVISWACVFFSASFLLRVAEAPGGGWTRDLLKVETLGYYSAISGAAGGGRAKFLGWPSVVSGLINHHPQTFMECLFSEGHGLTCCRTF